VLNDFIWQGVKIKCFFLYWKHLKIEYELGKFFCFEWISNFGVVLYVFRSHELV
jgi:hypothetical protein